MINKDNETKFILKGKLSEQLAEMYLQINNPSNQDLRKLKDELTDSSLELLCNLHYMEEPLMKDFLTALLQVRGILSVLEVENMEKFNENKLTGKTPRMM